MEKIRLFFKEATHELLTKVNWPTWEELQGNLMVVLVASFIFALVIYIMDMVFSGVLTTYYNLFQ
jgi:preprotein translocase subunit SecE